MTADVSGTVEASAARRNAGIELVDDSVAQHLLWIRTAAQADRSIWPQVLMDARDLVVVVISVRNDLAPRAERLIREGQGGMAPVAHHLVQIAG